MKPRQLYRQKSRVQDRYVIELDIHEIGDPVRYPDGIKYGLACIDLVTGKRVLMDNHHPKGSHIHLDQTEFKYSFEDVPTLMADFKRIVFEHLEVKL